MASYFDLPPQKAAAAASIDQVPEEERKQLGRMSLMSPAVSQLLEDLGNEHSDSSSEEGNLSEEEDLARLDRKKSDTSSQSQQDKKNQHAEKAHEPSSLSPKRSSLKSSPSKGSGHVRLPPARPSAGGSAKKKPTHMARFHSLRSMLFQANIEDKMSTATKETCQKEEAAADMWKSQHEQRQMHRPKTPEKEVPVKDGITSRLKTSLRRMTSKEVPTLEKIREDGVTVEFDDHASTASSDNEDEPQHSPWKQGDGDNESIHHSDVEDLVRWVSRRDPPSDGEARKGGIVQTTKEDSGHESLGNSDVEDLVRWVNRRSDTKEGQDHPPTRYSDVSTESDSELVQNSSEEEEADDLVRWVSHRDGPRAGPVRRDLERPELDSEGQQHYDSDVPELGRWFKRHDGTSGESGATTPAHERAYMVDEEERGRPRSRDSGSSELQQQRHLTNDDVDKLVRWVSRKDSKQQEQSTLENDERIMEWKRQEEEKKKEQQLQPDTQMEHRGSLANEDVDELVRWVSRKT